MKNKPERKEIWGKKNYPWLKVFLILLLIAIAIVSLMVGRFDVSPVEVVLSILSGIFPNSDKYYHMNNFSYIKNGAIIGDG